MVFAVRCGRLNREWLDVRRMLEVAGRVPGVRPLAARLSLVPPAGEQPGDEWGDEWRDATADNGWESDWWESGRSLRAANGRDRLVSLVGRLQNCSVLLGVTGDALASALWMRPGSLVVQVFPYGVRGRYGREVSAGLASSVSLPLAFGCGCAGSRACVSDARCWFARAMRLSCCGDAACTADAICMVPRGRGMLVVPHARLQRVSASAFLTNHHDLPSPLAPLLPSDKRHLVSTPCWRRRTRETTWSTLSAAVLQAFIPGSRIPLPRPTRIFTGCLALPSEPFPPPC